MSSNSGRGDESANNSSNSHHSSGSSHRLRDYSSSTRRDSRSNPSRSSNNQSRDRSQSRETPFRSTREWQNNVLRDAPSQNTRSSAQTSATNRTDIEYVSALYRPPVRFTPWPSTTALQNLQTNSPDPLLLGRRVDMVGLNADPQPSTSRQNLRTDTNTRGQGVLTIDDYVVLSRMSEEEQMQALVYDPAERPLAGDYNKEFERLSKDENREELDESLLRLMADFANRSKDCHAKEHTFFKGEELPPDDENLPNDIRQIGCFICLGVPFDFRHCTVCYSYWCAKCLVPDTSTCHNSGREHIIVDNPNYIDRARLVPVTVEIYCQFCDRTRPYYEGDKHASSGCDKAKCERLCGLLIRSIKEVHETDDDCSRYLREFKIFVVANINYFKSREKTARSETRKEMEVAIADKEKDIERIRAECAAEMEKFKLDYMRKCENQFRSQLKEKDKIIKTQKRDLEYHSKKHEELAVKSTNADTFRRSSDEELVKVRQELQRLKSRKEKAEIESKKSIDELSEKVKTLEKKLAEKSKQKCKTCRKLEEELKHAENENKSLTERNKSLSDQNETLINQNETLIGQIQTLKDSQKRVPTATITNPNQTEGVLPTQSNPLLQAMPKVFYINATDPPPDTPPKGRLQFPVPFVNAAGIGRQPLMPDRRDAIPEVKTGDTWQFLRDNAFRHAMADGVLDTRFDASDFKILDLRMSVRDDPDQKLSTSLRHGHTFNLVPAAFFKKDTTYVCSIEFKEAYNIQPMYAKKKALEISNNQFIYSNETPAKKAKPNPKDKWWGRRPPKGHNY